MDRPSAETVPGIEAQALTDRDQTAGDADHTASEADQASSDRDQTASREAELSSARDETAVKRGDAARTRDATAWSRDQAAHLRDEVADARDQKARKLDDWSKSMLRKKSDALRGKQAARDRAHAATDRGEAAHDRSASAHDREGAAHDRELAATDPLTGTRARSAGLAELQREVDRARRSTGSLVLAFVDVDGLKQVNDSEGHVAGDQLLAAVASALRGGLRSYDLIMRFGGDEFLCALSGIETDEVKRRFDKIAKHLATRSSGHSICAGFAELQDGDDTQALIARADDALLKTRRAT